ncbi:MAG: diacylglycerol kinase [Rhodococcus sp. (in: high G+C Gram-positive bacteria)]
MTAHVTVLTNPTAGNGRAARVSEAVVRRLRERGARVTTIEGRTPGDAVTSTRRAVRGGTDVLLAVGGDGLVNIALQAVATTDTPIAVAPAGTGNDFARLLGVPLNDAVAAADIVVDRRTADLDLGRVQDRWFATVLSSGFDSLVTERANTLRWPTGRLRYNLATVFELTKLQPIPYRLELDGVAVDFDATLVTVGNGPSYGGGMAICPGAMVDDGLLDVTVVRATRRSRLIRLSPTLYRGAHVQLPEVDTYRAKSVCIDAPAMVAYADGERFCALPVRIDCVRRALTAIVGPSYPRPG